MLPVLRLAADKQDHKFRDAVEALADEFLLTDQERNELLPSGSQAVFNNRVGWARSYLKQAGLLKSPRRGYFSITERGLNLLRQEPEKINVETLEDYQEFVDFRSRRRDRVTEKDSESAVEFSPEETPEDALASAYRKLRKGGVGG